MKLRNQPEKSRVNKQGCIYRWPGEFEVGQEVVTLDSELGNIVAIEPENEPDGYVPVELASKKIIFCLPDELTRVF